MKNNSENYLNNYFLHISVLGCLLIASCQMPWQKAPEIEQTVIASYNDQVLSLEEVNFMHPDGIDSARFAEQYIERWVRDQVIAEAAKNAMPGIQKELKYKMQDEERKWLKHKYTDYLIVSALDTTIDETDIQNYYEENKATFTSKAPYYCYFHVRTSLPNQYQLVGWLKGTEQEEINQAIKWSKDNAIEYRLDSSYVTETELTRISKGYYGDLKRSKKNVVFNYEYETDSLRYFNFFKLIEIIDEGKPLPLVAVRNRIKLYLLSQKKQLLIDRQLTNLLDRAKTDNKVKRFSNE